MAEAQKKLSAANDELTTLKSAPPPTASATATAAAPDANTQAITQERDKLKAELDARSKELADAEAHHDQELINVRSALQDAQRQRDDLQKKLDGLMSATPKDQPVAEPPPSAPPPATPAPATTAPPASSPPSTSAEPENPGAPSKLEQLQARNAVLEANPVPYTAEELAVLKLSPSSAAPPRPSKRWPIRVTLIPPKICRRDQARCGRKRSTRYAA